VTQQSTKRVLVCPLDWGLGHASRDVQIIEALQIAGFEVIVGADGVPLFFLRQYFTAIPFVKFSSFQIEYPSKGSMVLKMALSVPKILFGIFKEHWQLKKIIKEHQIDCIISDNRYGLWNKNVFSVFVGHQIFIKTPFKIKIFDRILNAINHWFINKFDECWVPDYLGDVNLSGTLSHQNPLPKNVSYIGVLSRFKLLDGDNIMIDKPTGIFDILVILSGPEPQRSIFEKILIDQISDSTYSALFVRGKPFEKDISDIGNIKFVNHLPTNQIKDLILNTPIVISRSGYSTIMDLFRLKKNAILVPPPGQTEQEYLAKLMAEKKWFYTVSQNKFELELAIGSLSEFSPENITLSDNLLDDKLKKLTELLSSK